MAQKKAEEIKSATPQVDPVADAEARIAAMFAAAEAKIEAMLAEAEAKASGKHNLSEKSKAINDANEEYIAVKLFKDNGRYSEDEYACVNGENCVIPRGKYVKIKRKFMKALELSDLQDTKTAQFMDEEENKYLDEAKRLNL